MRRKDITAFLLIFFILLMQVSGCGNSYSKTLKEIDSLAEGGSYQDALEKLENFKKQYPDRDEVKDLEEKIRLGISAENLAKGMKLLDEGQLEDALKAFEMVVQEDSGNYTKAIQKMEHIRERMFENYVNSARDYYSQNKTDLAVAALESALEIRDSQPVRELINLYKSRATQKETILDVREAIKRMQTYEKGTGQLKIALDNTYSKEFRVGDNSIKTSGDTVFMSLWVNIENDSDEYCRVKPEFIKITASDGREFLHHSEYSKMLSIPFVETHLPPGDRASGWLMFLLPLEDSYSFEYNDRKNSVTKTVILH